MKKQKYLVSVQSCLAMQSLSFEEGTSFQLKNILQETARQMDRKLEKLDRKLNQVEQKAETWFSKRMSSTRKMYRKHILGDSSNFTVDELYMLNMYILAFSAGTMLGVGTAKII